MQKTILHGGILASFAASAQNVDDQKISFNYIQQPITPIKGTKVFSIVVDHSVYQASNDDSLKAFELQLNLAESQLETWIEQKKKVDQMYLLEMAKWEKAVNAGAVLAQPNKQPYPEMPKLKEELRMPILTEEISDGIVDGKVTLEGFSKGEGGAVVTIQFSGIRETNIVEKVTGAGATKKYEYTAEYLMPYSIKVEAPGQGVIINENLSLTKKTKAFDKYDSKYDFEYWCIDNLDNFWKTLQQDEVAAALTNANNLINDKCGFPLKTNSTEVYTVKKHKGHSYSDLIDGYTKAKSGYDLVYKSISRKEAASTLQTAIKRCEYALSESNMQDNK